MSSLPPRPKPWETKSAAEASSTPVAPSAFPTVAAAPTTSLDVVPTASSSVAPRLPDRPTGLTTDSSLGGFGNSAFGQTGSAFGQTGYGAGQTSSYGMTPYGMGGYSSYSSPYSRMGGMGGMGGMGSYGGGYGGYGGMSSGYGGYGGGMGGMGYGVGGMGMPGEGYGPNLTSSMQQSTAPAFQVIESIVTAFTSLAQLVESTYMATHSSFFAMVGVADQLGSLKSYLGQVLGVFSIMRLGRRIINWLRGKKVSTGPDGWANEWSNGLPGANAPRPSAKPLLLFLLSAVGLPYLMSRLVKLLIASQQAQAAANGGQLMEGPNGVIDPNKLTFARARWEFRPSEEWELALQPDEIVAVLERRDTGTGNPNEVGWWRGRTRDGRMGWFPGNYVEEIKKREGGMPGMPGTGPVPPPPIPV